MNKPLAWSIILIFILFTSATGILLAKIPEPSNVVYGTIHIDGMQILKTDTEVTIVARLANTELASYQMGSNTSYGDQYLLKIPLDSVGNRNANSTQTDDVINIFVSNMLANTITIGDRGTIQENNLAVDATDTDSDGMPDYWETQYGLLINTNDANLDKDSDGLSNLAEYLFGSNPTIPDSDGDGMIDLFEHTNGFNPNDASDALLDTDGDGLTNFQESQNGTNPRSDDSDGDGMSDAFEVQYGLNPNDAADAASDLDEDGYTNLEEYENSTDPSTDNSASQDQLVMLAQADLYSGDISALEADETSVYIASHNSDEVKVISTRNANTESLSASQTMDTMSSQTALLENTIATNSKNGNNAIVKWNHLLIIATGDNQIVVRDLLLKKQIAELMALAGSNENNTSILSLAVDDSSLVAGASNGKIYVWHNNNGNFDYDTSWKANASSLAQDKEETGFITSVSLSETKIFSARLLPEKAVNAWDRNNNYPLLFELKGEAPCCQLPTLTNNQSSLVLSKTFSKKSLTSIPLSELSIEDTTHETQKEHESRINVVQASTNHVISADETGVVYIWNQNSSVLVTQFKAHTQAIRSLKIKGNLLITGSISGEVKIWEFPY